MTQHTICVCGVGALGSHFVQFARCLDSELYVVDYDRVERKNTLSQFHSQKTVGQLKVQAIQKTMSFLWGSKVDGHFSSKLEEDNAHFILRGSTLIVDCFDNAAARKVVQDYARLHDIPCIHGALAADGQFGRVVWDENFVIDSESVVGQATCDGGEHLPLIVVTSAYLVRAVQKFIEIGEKRIGWTIHPGGVTST